MARTYDLLVRARGDTRDAERAMRRLQRNMTQLGRHFKNVGRALSLAVTAPIVAAGALGAKELMEMQKATAQTNAVIQSTGGAANVSAKQVTRLAEALLAKSGVDDQVIQSGENMLLTFTKIRNEAGKGNDVFNQATKAALDMSVAMGTDMSKTAIQVGKALNDPIKGITALRKVGVQFTDQQREQIKAMVAAGDTMGAQKLILAELNTEFGGSAAAYGKTLPGMIGKLKEQFAGLAASIVAELVPAVTAIMSKLSGLLDHFSKLDPQTRKVIAIMAVLAAAIGPVLWAVGSLITTVSALMPVLVALTGPVGLVVAGCVALAAAFVYAYTHSESFRDKVNGAIQAIRDFVVPILDSLKSTMLVWAQEGAQIWRKFGGDITHAVVLVFQPMADLVGGFLRVTRDVVLAALALLRGDWRGAWGHIKHAAVDALEAVVSYVTDFAKVLLKAGTNAGEAIVKGVVAGATGIGKAIGGVFDKALEWLANKVKEFVSAGEDLGSGIVRGIKSALKLPHVSVDIKHKKVSHGPDIPYPSFDVDWYARGGVVRGPRVIGVGEAGPEAIVPLAAGRAADRARVMAEAGLGGVVNIVQNFTGEPDMFAASRQAAWAVQTSGLVAR